MTDLPLDAAILEEARRFNRKLAWAPRFRVRNRLMPMLGQGLLRVSQLGAGHRLARAGIRVERRLAAAGRLRVPVRILRPAGPVQAVVLDIHGGGWVIGNACMDDRFNAARVEACAAAVVSVDYRLATGAGIDDIIEDCVVAARWLLDGGLPEYRGLPVFVIGESAGAHLAASALLCLKAWPALLERVAGAVLFYGVYDLAGTPFVHAAGPETLVLHGPSMAASLRLLTPHLDDAGRRRPPLSPLFGDLAGMPPALMFAGERDPLRDDSTQMAARWRQVNEVELHLLPEAPHGFIHFPTRMAGLALARSHAWINAQVARREQATMKM
ncbi:alpha/beta hydrolase fold domain-containing protein [Massilia haematophila]|uniref:Alpha/beta hydrolase fold domain-containing protein n=1 Tax=Massilia haematophila TaxID=457923 RepID=A0ABV7PE44_9BURK